MEATVIEVAQSRYLCNFSHVKNNFYIEGNLKMVAY